MLVAFGNPLVLLYYNMPFKSEAQRKYLYAKTSLTIGELCEISSWALHEADWTDPRDREDSIRILKATISNGNPIGIPTLLVARL